jgi:hypothetical protein
MERLLFVFCLFAAFAKAQPREFEVHFETDSYRLTAAESQKLDQFIGSLPANAKKFTVNIAGHTDDVGDIAYNAVLSDSRANAIATIFKNKGFTDAQILTSGRGEVHPIANNTNETGKAKNRRAKIRVFTEMPRVENIGGVRLKESAYQIDPRKPETIHYISGTQITIPENAFVDSNGKPVNGKVDIKYIEYRDPIDFILSGIPMDHGGGTFNSGGMFKITAYQNGNAVYLDKNKKIDIDFAQLDNPAPMNFYRFDSITKQWTELAKLPKVAVSRRQDSVRFDPVWEEGSDYYCSGNRCYSQMQLIKQSKQYLQPGFSAKATYLEYKKRVENYNTQYQNSLREMVYVDLPGVTGYFTEAEAKDRYDFAIAQKEKLITEKQQEVGKYIPTYHLVRFGNRKTTKFRINFKAAGARPTQFLRTTFKSDEAIPAETLAKKWDSCHISHVGENYTIVLQKADTVVTLRNLSIKNPLYQNEPEKLLSIFDGYQTAQKRRIKPIIDNIAVAQKLITQYKKPLKKEMISAQSGRNYMYSYNPTYCFWQTSKDFMTATELQMTEEEWCSYFDDNRKLMAERYAKINVSEECRKEAERQIAMEAATKNGLALRQSLQIDNLGVYNCDQIYRIKDPLIATARYQTTDGKPVNPFFIYVIDNRVNGIFAYNSGYANASPTNFPYGSNSRNKILAFDLENNSYIVDVPQFDKAVKANPTQPVFILRRVGNVANKEALRDELDL